MTQYNRAELPPWTRVVTPHSDIVEGRLSMDTYAVQLDLVIQDSSTIHPVYREPRLFFEATYLTTELRRILTEVMSVLTGESGDRVLQLRTPFGGGKTHTLLALYHLAKSRDRLRDLADLKDLPDPGEVRIVVISGMERGAADRLNRQRRTLWGELAAQLGRYELVAEQDRLGVAPGGEVLRELIGEQPTLLLLDEMLTYVENASAVPVGESTLGRQTLTFLQRLTEVIAASPRAALIYSLQASEQEAGGNQALLDTMTKIVQRVTGTREPVSGDEVLNIVQRRLFASLGDEQQRRSVARAYAESYRAFALAGGIAQADANHQADQLRERILNSYPFHPALLDLMRERWSSLPSYQRTRGALQFLATVIHSLWSNNIQTQPLLGPGDVPLNENATRISFHQQVGEREQYEAVVLADLTGANAGARAVDQLLIRDSPHLQAFLPGTRIATAALLYSFGGKSEQERGVYESELLSACLAPGLDRNTLQLAMHDLNDRLLYLHRAELRYRFETQPNLNKMISDEKQRRSDEEIETRLRDAFGKKLGDQRDAVVWPDDPLRVPDKLEEHQIVYFSPAWLEANPDPAKQEREKRRYIEECGNIPRKFRNALTLAVPDAKMAGEAKNAVRMIMTLELIRSQSAQRQLTAQQLAELAERLEKAEGDLSGSFSHLYPVVYTPQASDQAERPYTLEPLQVRNYSQATQLHTLIKEALKNRVVWDSVQPSKLVSLSGLNRAEEIEKQFYPVSELVAGFFRYFTWTHVWNADVIRQAIAVGVRNRAIGYVANARKDEQERLILSSPAADCIFFGADLSWHNLDTGEGTYILSAAYAQQLLTPPAPEETRAEPEPQPGDEGAYQPGAGVKNGVSEPAAPAIETEPGTPVPPGQGGQRYRLQIKLHNTGDLFQIMQSLERLEKQAEQITTIVSIVANSKPGQSFQRNTLHNLVVESITEETKATILEEQVEQ